MARKESQRGSRGNGETEYLQIDSPAVQTHLTNLQNLISRMSNLGANVKNWAAAIMAALLVWIFDKGTVPYGISLFSIIVVFCALDCYYLSLEREFRTTYNDFVSRLHDGNADRRDLFVIKVQRGFWLRLHAMIEVCDSPAIWPFYGMLTIAVGVGVLIKVCGGNHGTTSFL